MLNEIAVAPDPGRIVPSLSIPDRKRAAVNNTGDAGLQFFVRSGAAATAMRLVNTAHSLRARWADVESTYNSACIGMICRSEQHSDDLVGLLSDGLAGEPLPGAIVVKGQSSGFLKRLLQVACACRQPVMINLGGGLSIPFEWPAILVVKEDDTADLLSDLLIAQTLRESGVPVEVFIQEDGLGDHGVKPEQAFLQKNLLEHFPKIL